MPAVGGVGKLAFPARFQAQLLHQPAHAVMSGEQALGLERGLARLLGVVLRQPAAHRAVHQVLVTAHLPNAQALLSDQLHDLQLEGGIKGSTVSAQVFRGGGGLVGQEYSLSRCP